MVRILVVEDERPISDLLKLNMKKAGYEPVTAYDGLSAADRIAEEHFDLILLDVMLPGANGFELMDMIRPTGTPVIFITAKSALEDKLAGLTSGAEDYIVKPFEISELLARIGIVLRRTGKGETELSYGDLLVEVSGHLVKKAGEAVELTPKEFELCCLFLRNVDVLLGRTRIYEEIWGGEMNVESRTLDLHIQRLRKKLGWKDCLKSVYNTGYRLCRETKDGE